MEIELRFRIHALGKIDAGGRWPIPLSQLRWRINLPTLTA
jgi:hypothetical protein